MNTLLMDTSSPNMLVALKSQDILLEGEKVNTSKHLETLMPAVQRLLEQKDYGVANIDYLGVVVGPGSFTGIRIAVATAKAMMMVNRKLKAVAVNTFELMDYIYRKQSQDKNKVVYIIPTTIKKVYYAEFDQNGRVGEDKIVELASLKDYAGEHKIISSVSLDGYEVCDITTAIFGEFVDAKIYNKDFADILAPCYVGLSQAEEQLKNKENK